MNCYNCGSLIPDGIQTCPICGAQQMPVAPNQPMESYSAPAPAPMPEPMPAQAPMQQGYDMYSQPSSQMMPPQPPMPPMGTPPKKSNTGLIVGLIVGAIVIIAIICTIVFTSGVIIGSSTSSKDKDDDDDKTTHSQHDDNDNNNNNHVTEPDTTLAPTTSSSSGGGTGGFAGDSSSRDTFYFTMEQAPSNSDWAEIYPPSFEIYTDGTALVGGERVDAEVDDSFITFTDDEGTSLKYLYSIEDGDTISLSFTSATVDGTYVNWMDLESEFGVSCQDAYYTVR